MDFSFSQSEYLTHLNLSKLSINNLFRDFKKIVVKNTEKKLDQRSLYFIVKNYVTSVFYLFKTLTFNLLFVLKKTYFI